MKTTKTFVAIVILVFIGHSSIYGQKESTEQEANQMKTYLIEREIPQAGELSAEQLKGISQQSCSVLKEMGPDIQWLHSYVTDDKVYCLYKAKDEALIRQHAEAGGFPVNYVTELSTRIDPTTAE